MKREILEILTRNRDRYVSGETIRRELGISRTAVWKHVCGLVKKGYPIHPLRNKGYRLEISPGMLSRFELDRHLPAGTEYLFLETAPSTNDTAKEQAVCFPGEFLMVVASVQTSGKGRMGRKFLSDNTLGGWISFLMKPPQMAAEQGVLTTVAAGVAVCRAVESLCGVRPGIKWPNDVILNRKKLCGILCEMSSDMDRVNHIVAGIGINILQNRDDFPLELREIATSLYMETGIKYPRARVIASILEAMKEMYHRFITCGKYDILKEWKDYSLTLGKPVFLAWNDERWEGTALDIDMSGRLLVRLNDGVVRAFHSGEVSIRGVMGFEMKGENDGTDPREP